VVGVGGCRSRLEKLNESKLGWIGLRVLGLLVVAGIVVAVFALRGPGRGQRLVADFVRCARRLGYTPLSGAQEHQAHADFQAGRYRPGPAGAQLGGDPPDAYAELFVTRGRPRRYLVVARPATPDPTALPAGSRLIVVPASKLAADGGQLPDECSLSPPGQP
jgi:hypothetical protein